MQLLTDKQVSEILSISLATTRRMRLLNQGPRYLKIGASVRYRFEDLQEFIRNCAVGDGALQKEVD